MEPQASQGSRHDHHRDDNEAAAHRSRKGRSASKVLACKVMACASKVMALKLCGCVTYASNASTLLALKLWGCVTYATNASTLLASMYVPAPYWHASTLLAHGTQGKQARPDSA